MSRHQRRGFAAGASWSLSFLLHLGVLVLLLLLPHRQIAPPEEKVFVVDMADLPPPVPVKPPPVAEPPPRVVEQVLSEPLRLPDPLPDLPPDPLPDPAPDSSNDSGVAVRPPPQSAVVQEPSYLAQFQVDSVPELPLGRILDRITYPPLAAKQGLQATVILELLIDREGYIRKVNVLKDPGFGFAEAAATAVLGLQVTPASAGGQPVAVRFRYPVRFSLR